jgi:hypothetical protein
LLAKNPILLTQILDRLLLVPVHPAGNRHQQELERIEHSRHRFPDCRRRNEPLHHSLISQFE